MKKATITVISPGNEEYDLKDQDRGKVLVHEEKCIAIICDGTSTSPMAGVAAAYVVNSVSDIFNTKNGLQNVVDELLRRREELLKAEIKLSEDQEASRSIFEEIITEKRKVSFQTTFIAVEWTLNSKHVKLKWIGCGDSALFVFTRGKGKLLWNNLYLQDEYDLIKHSSTFTEVIPDMYNKEKHIIIEKEFPTDTCLLLCSDGFYDIFENFKEIYIWLVDHVKGEIIFHDEKVRALMLDLHEKLRSKKGDDDISFVLCLPYESEIHLEYNYSKDETTSSLTTPIESKKRNLISRFFNFGD